MPALPQLPALVVEDPRGRRPLPVPGSRDGALLGDPLTGLGSLPHDFQDDPLTFLGGARYRSSAQVVRLMAGDGSHLWAMRLLPFAAAALTFKSPAIPKRYGSLLG